MSEPGPGQPLWHGRFAEGPSDELLAFTVSLGVDRRLAADDSPVMKRLGVLGRLCRIRMFWPNLDAGGDCLGQLPDSPNEPGEHRTG